MPGTDTELCEINLLSTCDGVNPAITTVRFEGGTYNACGPCGAWLAAQHRATRETVDLPEPDGYEEPLLWGLPPVPYWRDPLNFEARWRAHHTGVDDDTGYLRDSGSIRSVALVMLAVANESDRLANIAMRITDEPLTGIQRSDG